MQRQIEWCASSFGSVHLERGENIGFGAGHNRNFAHGRAAPAPGEQRPDGNRLRLPQLTVSPYAVRRLMTYFPFLRPLYLPGHRVAVGVRRWFVRD